MSKLALLGGEKAVTITETDCFKWPIVTEEDEAAVLEVIREGRMSHSDITKEFEADYCKWTGSKYALGTNNGTSALLSAMYGCGVGKGDEIICPSITYWASCTSAYTLGATVVFADIDPYTLCLDPKKLELEIQRLMGDEDVTRKSGIYEYLLTGDERKLSIRQFDMRDRLAAYAAQLNKCAICGKKFEFEQMQADHIIPWSRGGKSTPDNCQMLCTKCNLAKSNH